MNTINGLFSLFSCFIELCSVMCDDLYETAGVILLFLLVIIGYSQISGTDIMGVTILFLLGLLGIFSFIIVIDGHYCKGKMIKSIKDWQRPND
jgi:hypothetical protein